MNHSSLDQAIDKEKRLQNVREQAGGNNNPVQTNDIDYEDKQKQQDSNLVYEGLRFNLAAESSKNLLSLPNQPCPVELI